MSEPQPRGVVGLLLCRCDSWLVSYLGKEEQTGGLGLKWGIEDFSLSHPERCCVKVSTPCGHCWGRLDKGTWLIFQVVTSSNFFGTAHSHRPKGPMSGWDCYPALPWGRHLLWLLSSPRELDVRIFISNMGVCSVPQCVHGRTWCTPVCGAGPVVLCEMGGRFVLAGHTTLHQLFPAHQWAMVVQNLSQK